MQRFTNAMASICLGGTLLFASQAHALSVSLAQAQQRALADSPRLSEIAARYQAAQTIPEQMGALPDPSVTVGLLSVPTNTFDLDQEAMTQFQVGIQQPLPWPGKLKLKSSVAQFGAGATEQELAEARLMLSRDVVKSWWNLYFTERALEVVRENQQKMREFNRITLSRYRVGKGVQQDALQAQLELSALLEREVVLTGQRRVQAAGLNALLARDAQESLELISAEPPAFRDLPQQAELLDRALRQRPLLRQRMIQLDAAREKTKLAELGLIPDFTLGASYGYRQSAPNGADRADLLSLTLGIKIPLYALSKQRREIDQREAEVMASKDRLHETQLQVRSQIVSAVAAYERAGSQAELLENGILPQARQTVASMLSGFQVGQVDFTALVRAQLMVNNLQLQYWRALVDGQQAQADLVAALGGDLYE